MSVSASLSNVFADAYRLIESNLTPFEINNMRIATKRPLLDLSLCTTKQVVQGIEDGVDFRELPVFLRAMEQKTFDIFAFLYRCGDAIVRRNERLGYEWLCRIPSAYPGNFKCYGTLLEFLLCLDNIPETNWDLAKQVVVEFLESGRDNSNILSSLERIPWQITRMCARHSSTSIDSLTRAVINGKF